MKILIVEDNTTYSKLIFNYINKMLLFSSCDIVSSFEELKKIKKNYDLFIVDYVLEDTIKDEHIKYLIEKNKKIIVMTAFEDKLLSSNIKDKIIDYIIKEDISVIYYLVKLIKRFYKNKHINILLVEDFLSIRKYEKNVLKMLNLNVFEAENGQEALKILEKEEINLIITDIEMPKKNGIELVKDVRKNYEMDLLPILVVSSEKDTANALKILKLGANDLIKKPFLKEELVIRVNNLLDLYDYLFKYKNLSVIDSLTGVYNRTYLEYNFEKNFNIFNQKSIAMLDIDFFKKVNDTYGHQTGDKVLKYFADLMKKTLRKDDIVIRYGGEEFLVFMPNTSKKEAIIILTKIKVLLKKAKDKPIDFTFSAGVADNGDTLAEMIKRADERLYTAKNNGRNKIVIK